MAHDGRSTRSGDRRRARRDRRGRGVRGPLVPAELPGALSRAEQFEELVLSSLDRLDRRWSDELAGIEVVVADVPEPPGLPGAAESTTGPARVPLGHAEPAGHDRPGRIVVHRRPLEARATGRREREDLVHAVLVQQLAELLGLEPEAVDPDVDVDGPGWGGG